MCLFTDLRNINLNQTYLVIGKYKPHDATTNPALILATSKKPSYVMLIRDAAAAGKKEVCFCLKILFVSVESDINMTHRAKLSTSKSKPAWTYY